MNFLRLFNIEIGRYGWVRFDIPTFSIKYQYEFGYYMYRIVGLTFITEIRMFNRGEINKII